MDNYQQLGYLHTNFRLFYLTDSSSEEPDYHYHNFDKIIIFIKGKISYTIEGRSYDLQPYDIVLVNQFHIHKPFIDNQVPYERIIIYIAREFIDTYRTSTYDLSSCFHKATEESSYVLRIPNIVQTPLLESIQTLVRSFQDTAYAHELKQQLDILQFLIHLNRASQSDAVHFITNTNQNQKLLDIMEYINSNLSETISVDLLSERFFISKYYLMRTFRKCTGYTILDYLTMKRMILARSILDSNVTISLTEVAFQVGYHEYSTFYRAYRKFYGHSPKFSKFQL